MMEMYIVVAVILSHACRRCDVKMEMYTVVILSHVEDVIQGPFSTQNKLTHIHYLQIPTCCEWHQKDCSLN